MVQKNLLSLLLVVVMALACSAGRARAENGLTVTGSIAFMDLLKKNSDEVSYLQLIPVSPAGKVGMHIVKGKLLFKSDLPKFPIPADGKFRLEMGPLKPGRYLLAAQMLTAGSQYTALALRAPKVTAEVIIPPDAKFPLTVNLGQVAFPIRRK